VGGLEVQYGLRNNSSSESGIFVDIVQLFQTTKVILDWQYWSMQSICWMQGVHPEHCPVGALIAAQLAIFKGNFSSTSFPMNRNAEYRHGNRAAETELLILLAATRRPLSAPLAELHGPRDREGPSADGGRIFHRGVKA
jgi:hypothetical protein